jgi:hypothetical protein
MWAEYFGPLVANGRNITHIIGVKFQSKNNSAPDTMYFENLKLRAGADSLNFNDLLISKTSSDANIELVKGSDTLHFFLALQTSEFDREFNGIQFTQMPTVERNNYGEIVYNAMIEFNLKNLNKTGYILTLTKGEKIEYKLCSKCQTNPTRLSFLNKETGNIYFIEKDCYLELVDSLDMAKFSSEY